MDSSARTLDKIVHAAFSPARAIIKRWGSRTLREKVWDSEYRHGDWPPCQDTQPPAVCEYIHRYANNGSVLDLGCGDGIIGAMLDETRYTDYIGVDISQIAIDSAMEASARLGRERRNRYVLADISQYAPPAPVDVILFRQSIYYLTATQIPETLANLRQHLKPHGAFIVVMADVSRHGWIADLIRSRFVVREDNTTGNTIVQVFS